jgi:hypothetical protein
VAAAKGRTLTLFPLSFSLLFLCLFSSSESFRFPILSSDAARLSGLDEGFHLRDSNDVERPNVGWGSVIVQAES